MAEEEKRPRRKRDTEPEEESWKVRDGLEAFRQTPWDPQWYLAESNHPYAPFPGNAIKWESYVYDDGSMYEGLMREDIPHGKGTLTFGLGNDGSGGGGGGIQNAGIGDRYEGEFNGGFASGLGMYTARSGQVYRGQWRHGLKHGCGVMHDFSPMYKAAEKGQNMSKVWKKLAKQVSAKTIYGRWDKDRFFGVGNPYSLEGCEVNLVRGILEEMDTVLTKTRMFAHKPDGEVTYMALKDGRGNPAPVMQDPIHYPHGTGFLAPGPMGQCHPMPDSKPLKEEMRKHARNHERIFNMYNFDYDPHPDSDLVKAWRYGIEKWMEDAAELREELEENERITRQETRAREARVARTKKQDQQRPEERSAPSEDEAKAEAERKAEGSSEDDDGPIDDSELLASAADVQLPSAPVPSAAGSSSSAAQQQQQQAGPASGSSGTHTGSWWSGGPTIFASASLSRSGICHMNAASLAILHTFRMAAEHAPRRRSLTRPRRLSRG